MIELGDEVEDITTGLRGIVTSRTEYLNQCVRLGVQPRYNEKEQKLPDSYYVDEHAARVVKIGDEIRQAITANRGEITAARPGKPTNGPATDRAPRERGPR